MVWGTFAYDGAPRLVVLPKGVTVNADRYLKILKDNLADCFATTGTEIFQQDGAPCHTAKKVKKWLENSEVDFITDWLGQSPDILPIENLWAIPTQSDNASVPGHLVPVSHSWYQRRDIEKFKSVEYGVRTNPVSLGIEIDTFSLQQLENNGLRRHGSAVSLTSTTLSTTSGSSLKKAKGLHEKLAEIDTYRDILIRQMEALQTYFDACAESAKEIKNTEATCNGHGLDIEGGVEAELAVECNHNLKGSPIVGGRRLSPSPLPPQISRETLEKHGAYAIDFRGEALTFKATTAGILTTLGHCVDVMNQREESFKRRLEREGEKRKRLEEKLKHALSLSAQESPTARRVMVMGGPDYEEGPHSVMGEDEFFDAVESALDKMDEEEEFRERLRLKQLAAPQKPATTHPLWPEIDKVTKEQLSYAQQDVDGGVWQLFAEEGEMKMYRRELEEDGLVVDPLKAVHQIRGATAHEMAHHFWSPDVRFEWETTLEQVTVIDRISEDTLLFLQLHKRVWPTAQRDALFWSHIREISKTDPANGGAHDTWIVCNKSAEHPDAPNDGKCVRVDLTICFVCQTFIDPPPAEGEPITRDNLLTKIIYCSVVNPGGWAPASVLRTVYKREYPKFLKRFTQYVVDKSANNPIAFSGLKIKDQNKHWRG
ncbi:ceramide transfer protein-like [Palaemon carinicauda]|uniref:ceramide transfer protein-like n=1 Tax=Palaemon carinicauda TaxID=392227 RepID=UPI0035B67163